jgi:formiminoglutamase
VTRIHDDPNWPGARDWLGGSSLRDAVGSLRVFGAPVARGSITPGRCDRGPTAIREALRCFTTYDVTSKRDLRRLRVTDGGDLDLANATPEEAFEPIHQAVFENLEGTDAVVILGGNNSITRPGCYGLGLELSRCGLLTLDAHFDLRHLGQGLNNGNPVRALLGDGLPGSHIVQIGIQSFANSQAYARVAEDAGILVTTTDFIRRRGIEFAVDQALAYLDRRVDRIYVDLDLDVLDQMHAPAASGARPGGLAPWEVRCATSLCGAHPKVRAFDLVEINPTKDKADVTALTGRMFARICLWSAQSIRVRARART